MAQVINTARGGGGSGSNVEIVNNLISTDIDKALSAAQGKVLNDSKAPNNHASAATTYGVASATNYGHAMASSATPLVAGAASAGTDNGKFAREGHIHPAQTTLNNVTGLIKGNGASAATAAVAGTDYVIPSGSITGNAATANKLAVARNITLTGGATGSASFDGSGDASIAVTQVANQSNQKVGVSKNSTTVTGTRKAINFIDGANTTVTVADDSTNDRINVTIASVNTTYGNASTSTAGLMSATDKTKLDGIGTGANVTSVAGKTGVVTLVKGDIALGNVDNTADAAKNVLSATKFTTARTIALSGGATGTATSFDGSANITIPITSIDATKVTGVLPASTIPKEALERMTVVANDTARFALTTASVQNGDFVKVSATSMVYYVKDDTKLNVADGYEAFSAGSMEWSGITSKPTTLAGYGITDAAPLAHASSATTYGIATVNNYGHAKASNTLPVGAGTAAIGTDNGIFARGDHVHPAQVTISGNAATATKLQTIRTINGVNFDGTANITVADSTKLPLTGGTMSGIINFANVTPTFGNWSASTGIINQEMLENGSAYALFSGKVEGAKKYSIEVAGAANDPIMRLYAADTYLEINKDAVTTNKVIFNAAWNDYAEYFPSDYFYSAGTVVRDTEYSRVTETTKRLMRGCHIISDTYGMILGEKDKAVPVGLAGRVLAFADKTKSKMRVGDAVCSGKNGTVSRMRWYERILFPDRIIGTVHFVPSAEKWNNYEVRDRVVISI